MARRLFLALILSALAVGASACKQGGQLSMESDAPGPVSDTLSMVEGAEFVSGSQSATSSTHLYTIQSSTGDVFSGIQQTSTQNALLFSNVQGQMISTQ